MSKPSISEWGLTEQKIMKGNYMWKIKNFSHIKKPTGEKLESPTFTLTPDNTIKWYLALYPNGISSTCNYCMSASLGNRSESTFDPREIGFSICVLDKKQQIIHKKTKETRMGANSFNGFNEFLEKATLTADSSEILVNDVLTLFCEFTLSTDVENYSMSKHKFSKATSLKQKTVLNEIERQFEDNQFHDFTIIAPCGTQLKAHKFVLAARSPVFRAMFTSNMKENVNSTVKIEDIILNSLKEMLRFMYTGKLQNLDVCLVGVLMAAEKYQITGLKEECVEHLYKNLNISNAIETLMLCHRFKITDLKTCAFKFVMFHAKDINSEEFKSIDDPDLLVEVVQLLTLDS